MTTPSAAVFDAFSLSTVAFVIGVVPLAAVVVTSFLKMTVVLGLLRNAIGVQQVPSNMVINGIAMIIAAYIMAPVGMDAVDAMRAKPATTSGPQKFADAIDAAKEPYRKFLERHAHEKERLFFLRSAATIWPPERAAELKPNDLIVLAPAFMLSELSEAFQVGFLLYMAFVIVDLIMANVLLALGLSQLSPTTVSIPFKLLMFVVLDGWSVLLHGLVLTYR
jgi:type III secretion protein R